MFEGGQKSKLTFDFFESNSERKRFISAVEFIE